MTAQQEAHLARVKEEFRARVEVKYPAGALEHGGYLGDLTDLELIEHAMEEAVDEFCYQHALREKVLARLAPQRV